MRTRRCCILALFAVALSACSSVTSPVLRPPEGHARLAVSRDMGECKDAATPGVGTYAKAAGVGLLARVVSPFVGIWGALHVFAPTPSPAGAPSTSQPSKESFLVAAGIGAAAGIVAGPFVALHFASGVIQDEEQALFEKCLVARGFRPPSADVRSARLLVLLERDRVSERSIGAFTTELDRRGYVPGKTLEIETRWWDDAP